MSERLEPVRGVEEMGGFPSFEATDPGKQIKENDLYHIEHERDSFVNQKLLKKQITDQAYDRTVDKYNDQERMMREMVHSAVEKHNTLKDHFRKDKFARVLAGSALTIALIDMAVNVGIVILK